MVAIDTFPPLSELCEALLLTMLKGRTETNATPEDLVVVVMGPSGAGKSTFIRNILADDSVEYQGKLPEISDDSFKPTTMKPFPYIGVVKDGHWLTQDGFGIKHIILVDTPADGPMDISSSVTSAALFSTPTVKMALAVFMFPINHSGSCPPFLPNLESLWGAEMARNLAIVITKWPLASSSSNVEERRKKQLVDETWKPFLDKGACHYRAMGDDNPKNSLQLLQQILTEQIQRNPPPDVPRLRSQIVEKLNRDSALRRAYQNLQKDVAKASGDPDPSGGGTRRKWLIAFQEFLDRLLSSG